METLAETSKFMSSDDYKERFIAEYMQLKIRTEKLENYLAKCWAKVHCDSFELSQKLEKEYPHDCTLDLLKQQLDKMREYLFVLKQRSVIENLNII